MISESQPIIYREFKAAVDYVDVLQLERIAFGTETLSWMVPWLEQNPIGNSLMVVATCNQKIVGFLIVLPEQMCGFGKQHKCGYVMLAMTHPEYRRKGVYTKMSAYAFNLAYEQGFDFCLGYTVRKDALRAELKMGWHLADHIPILLFPLDLERRIKSIWIKNSIMSFILLSVERCLLQIAKKKSKNILKRSTHDIKMVSSFSSEYNHLAEIAVKERQVSLFRTSQLLNWRYSSNQGSGRKYIIVEGRKGSDLKGALVLRRKELLGFDSVVLLDILTDGVETSVLKELYAWVLINLISPSKPDLVGCMISKNRWEYRVLRRLGFLRSFKDYKMLLYPLRESLMSEYIDGRNWLSLWGNSDLV